MNGYNVNATLTFNGWVYIEADSAEEALEAARDLKARDFDYDPDGRVDFDVTPAVEETPF